MISVEEALERIFSLISPLDSETVPLRRAAGRVLAEDVIARRDQPPFSASVMDGYAVRTRDITTGARLKVVGEAAAGHSFDSPVGPGEAVRIFTGAPLPTGADRVVIQEDVTREGRCITIGEHLDESPYVRPRGTDFEVGDRLEAGTRLTPFNVALAASMNTDRVSVYRQPVVALIATGDELVMPGEAPDDNQIIASNSFGLAALFEREGADVRMLPIARDSETSLTTTFDLAKGADLVVTIGGASVGDHDLVGKVASELGMDRAFYKVAMRPGKPLMAGHIAETAMIGLPGNPVSSIVCGHIFIIPALRRMQGLGATPRARMTAQLGSDITANGPREHYMRAIRDDTGHIHVAERQDSSLLSVLAESDALVVRAPNDPARKAGETVEFIPL